MLVCEVTDGDTLTCSKELAEVRMPRSWGCGLCTYCHEVHHQSVNHLYCFAYHGSCWLLWIFWCCGLFSWNIKNLSGVNLYSFKICKSKVKGKWRLAFLLRGVGPGGAVDFQQHSRKVDYIFLWFLWTWPYPNSPRVLRMFGALPGPSPRLYFAKHNLTVSIFHIYM